MNKKFLFKAMQTVVIGIVAFTMLGSSILYIFN